MLLSGFGCRGRLRWLRLRLLSSVAPLLPCEMSEGGRLAGALARPWVLEAERTKRSSAIAVALPFVEGVLCIPECGRGGPFSVPITAVAFPTKLSRAYP